MWLRRAITIPGFVFAWCVLTVTLPLSLPIAVIVDLARSTRFALTRFLLFTITYLTCELLGLAVAMMLFVARAGPLREADRYARANYRLQWAWASALRTAAFRIFSITVDAKLDEVPRDKPILLLMRHASLADTILAACYLSKPYALRLRYVLKRELLWDPCLDVVGHRIPNHFVDRDADDSASELDRVAHLGDGAGPGQGVLIYPEGTRFSESRRARIIASAQSAGNASLERRARSYRSVLPPRPAGTLALIQHMPDAQIWVGNHYGFEVAQTARDLVSGALIGAHVALEFRSVGRPPEPSDQSTQREWLDALWHDVDRFVTENTKHA